MPWSTPRFKVIVLTGQGRYFCAGANIQELHDLAGEAAAQELSRRGQALCNLIESSPKPVLAALNGKFVLGGGAEIAMACHLRLCETSTQLASPEVQLGLMVGWGASQRLPRLVGLGRALDLLLTGRRVQADEALAIGLVNRVVEDGRALTETLALAEVLSNLSAPSLAATLSATLAGATGSGATDSGATDSAADGMAHEQALFGQLNQGADWREGTQAFLDKRPPRFCDV